MREQVLPIVDDERVAAEVEAIMGRHRGWRRRSTYMIVDPKRPWANQVTMVPGNENMIRPQGRSDGEAGIVMVVGEGRAPGCLLSNEHDDVNVSFARLVSDASDIERAFEQRGMRVSALHIYVSSANAARFAMVGHRPTTEREETRRYENVLFIDTVRVLARAIAPFVRREDGQPARKVAISREGVVWDLEQRLAEMLPTEIVRDEEYVRQHGEDVTVVVLPNDAEQFGSTVARNRRKFKDSVDVAVGEGEDALVEDEDVVGVPYISLAREISEELVQCWEGIKQGMTAEQLQEMVDRPV